VIPGRKFLLYGLAMSLMPCSLRPSVTPCPPAQSSPDGTTINYTLVATTRGRTCTFTYTISLNAGASLFTGGRYYNLAIHNSCTNFTSNVLIGSGNLKDNLVRLCSSAWYLANLDAITGLSGGALARPSKTNAATEPRVNGQAAQNSLVTDVNGDGIPDTLYLGATGVVVQILNSDGSTTSTNSFPTGFTPDQAFSTIVSADFNGDGKIDLAVSDPGTPGSTNGGVAILLGNGDGTFQAPKYFPAGQNPSSLAAADFNGDGKIDLAAASSSGSTIMVLSGNGDGTLGAAVSYANGGNSQATPASILAIDLNGDGRPDLVVANQGFVTVPDSSISTLLNTGSGFKPAFNAPLPLSQIPAMLAYSDLNNDGNWDLVATSPSSSATIVMFGKGDGTFQPPAYYAAGNSAGSVAVLPLDDGTSILVTSDQVSGRLWLNTVSAAGAIGAPPLDMVGGMPTGVAVADLNGDGQPDAVVAGGSSDVSVLLGQQNGQVAGPTGYSLGQPSPMPQAIAIGDLNKDGKPDVVVASQAGLVSTLLGNGDGTLKAPANIQVNPGAQSIALADLNRDGKLDAVVASYGNSGGLVALLGNGDGTFQAQPALAVNGLDPSAVAAGDLNGDGIPDLAVVMLSGVNEGSATLAVFLGKGDGTFQNPRTFPLKAPAASLTGVIGNFSGIVIGDWNGDGKPDIAAAAQAGETSIDILLGDGTGNFTEAGTLPATEDEPAYLATADINQDGIPDLVVAHCCGQSDTTYLLGNGDGTFQPENQILSGNSPRAVAVSTSGTFTTIVSADSGSAAITAVSLAASAAIDANVSAASGTITTLAPASIATIFGSNLATGTGSATTSALPSSLEGTTVSITDSSGAQHSAPLFYVSPKQVNYLLPADTATGQALVAVTNSKGVVGAAASQISDVSPGIFELDASGLAAAIVLMVAPDGSQQFQNIYQVGSSGSLSPLPISLSSGQVYLELYGTGIRNGTNVTATVGGVTVPVLSAGAQGIFLGLDQVNIGPLPASLSGKGNVNIALTVDGETANIVNATIQ